MCDSNRLQTLLPATKRTVNELLVRTTKVSTKTLWTQSCAGSGIRVYGYWQQWLLHHKQKRFCLELQHCSRGVWEHWGQLMDIFIRPSLVVWLMHLIAVWQTNGWWLMSGTDSCWSQQGSHCFSLSAPLLLIRTGTSWHLWGGDWWMLKLKCVRVICDDSLSQCGLKLLFLHYNSDGYGWLVFPHLKTSHLRYYCRLKPRIFQQIQPSSENWPCSWVQNLHQSQQMLFSRHNKSSLLPSPRLTLGQEEPYLELKGTNRRVSHLKYFTAQHVHQHVDTSAGK